MNKIKYPLKIDTNLFGKNNKTNSSFYGLSIDVAFCKKCVMSNQRPSSISEFNHTRKRKNGKYLNFNLEEICDACIYNEMKKKKITVFCYLVFVLQYF